MQNKKVMLLAFAALLLGVITASSQTQSSPDAQLRYKAIYQCNGEQVQVDHCRKDDDGQGFPPTKPQQNYCLVYYPDRPRRGGFVVQTAELYDDIVKKLQTCGALAGGSTASSKPATTPSQPGSDAQAHQYILLGSLNSSHGDSNKALGYYQRAIDLNPPKDTLAMAYMYQGGAYDDLKQFDKAVASFQESLTLKPGDNHTTYMLGLVYVEMGKKADALRSYQSISAADKAEADHLNLKIQAMK